jgi:hypothetical protein
MDFSDYYFLQGFTTKLDKNLHDNINKVEILCTDGNMYTSNESFELIMKKNFSFDRYDTDKIEGLYIKKSFFKNKNMNIVEYKDYYFFPFLIFEGNNLSQNISLNLDNVKSECDRSFFSVGFDTTGNIKYNILPFNKWISKGMNKTGKIQGTYIKKYKENLYMKKGIVICVTEKNGYHKMAICLIQIIRHLGCNLPIEIFYGNKELGINTINIFQRHKNVNCINLNSFGSNFNFSGYQIKPFSILFSSFEEVILLDADSIVFQNIENLFYDRKYLDTGSLFFYDQQNKRIHKNNTIKFINTNISDSFSVNYSEMFYEQCSSLLVFNKKKKWLSLLGICGLNYVYENTYKYVFGDKDTFWLGCMLFNQDFSFNTRLGIFTYPNKIKDVRKEYSEKHGGIKVLGEGDKVFLDDDDNPIHLNQFKMDNKVNNIIHNSSWNFYIWDKMNVYDNGVGKYVIDIDTEIFKIILKYHSIYLNLFNKNLRPPMNMQKFQKPERLNFLNKLLYENKMEDFERILNNSKDNTFIENNTNITESIIEPINDSITESTSIIDKIYEEGLEIETQESLIKSNSEIDTNSSDMNDPNEETSDEEIKDIDYERKVTLELSKNNETMNEIDKNNFICNTNDKCQEKNSATDTENLISKNFLNIIESNYNQFKNTLEHMENKNSKLEKENDFLIKNLKKTRMKVDKNNEQIKQLTFFLEEEKKITDKKRKVEKENKQLITKISVMTKEIEMLKNKLKQEKTRTSQKKNTENLETEEIEELPYLIDENEDIMQRNLKFFDMTNELKKDFESYILGITQIQKDVITHINSEDLNNKREWEYILRDITNFKNKKIKQDFSNSINNSLNLLISIAKNYTQ